MLAMLINIPPLSWCRWACSRGGLHAQYWRSLRYVSCPRRSRRVPRHISDPGSCPRALQVRHARRAESGRHLDHQLQRLPTLTSSIMPLRLTLRVLSAMPTSTPLPSQVRPAVWMINLQFSTLSRTTCWLFSLVFIMWVVSAGTSISPVVLGVAWLLAYLTHAVLLDLVALMDVVPHVAVS